MPYLGRLCKLSGREQAMVALVLIFSIGFLGYFLLIEPQAKEAERLRRSLQNTETKLQMRRSQVQQAATLEKSQQNLQQTFEMIHTRMFSGNELHPLLKHLAEDARRSDCTLLSILPRTDSTTKQSGALLTVESIEIRIQGSYRAITDMVRRIEQKPKFVSIDQVLLETTSRPHLLRAVLTLHVYSFNESVS